MYKANLLSLIAEDTDRLQTVDDSLTSLQGDVSVIAVYFNDREPTYLKNIEELRAALVQYRIFLQRRIRDHEERLAEI